MLQDTIQDTMLQDTINVTQEAHYVVLCHIAVLGCHPGHHDGRSPNPSHHYRAGRAGHAAHPGWTDRPDIIIIGWPVISRSCDIPLTVRHYPRQCVMRCPACMSGIIIGLDRLDRRTVRHPADVALSSRAACGATAGAPRCTRPTI